MPTNTPPEFRPPGAQDLALLLLRLGIGALMLSHGIPKLQALLAGGPVQFPPVMGMSPLFSLSLAVFAEALCSILLMAGLLTRLATVPLLITMLVAIFSIHAADPFDKKELAVQYLLCYLVLLLAGPGWYSLDAWLWRKGRKTSPQTELQH